MAWAWDTKRGAMGMAYEMMVGRSEDDIREMGLSGEEVYDRAT